jgi:UMP-CMP kinase
MIMKLRNSICLGGPTSALLLLLKSRALHGFAVATGHLNGNSNGWCSTTSNCASKSHPSTFITKQNGINVNLNLFPSRGGSLEHANFSTHRKASTAEDVTTQSVDNDQVVQKEDDNNDDEEVRNAALEAQGISNLKVSTFGNIPYLNTNSNSEQTMHKVLFILGGPGAGKGTQSEKIVSTYKCIHLSVGELLRNERAQSSESEEGKMIEECLVAGKIVPVEISLALVRKAMDQALSEQSDSEKERYGQPLFLVDGFPRNYDNLSGWTSNMPSSTTSVLGALVYDCPLEVLEQRILSRAETSGRSDDNLESAKKRFQTFQSQTMPVVRALELVEEMQIQNQQQVADDGEKIGQLHIQHIKGQGTIDEVWSLTEDAMDRFVSHDVLTANAMLLEAVEKQDLDTYVKLCSPEMLKTEEGKTSNDDNEENKSTYAAIFENYESISNLTDSDEERDSLVYSVKNTKIEIFNGTRATVSYDRRVESTKSGKNEVVAEYRETRVWSHQEQGWVCIHFSRNQLISP